MLTKIYFSTKTMLCLLRYRYHNVVSAKIHQATTNKQHQTTLIQYKIPANDRLP